MKARSSFSTLLELIRYRVEDTPNQRVFLFLRDGESEEATLTFAEMDQRARGLAQRLQAVAQPGERVLLLLPSSLDSIVAFVACLYAGVVAVPCMPPLPERPLTAIQAFATDAQACVALTNTQVLDPVRQQIAQIPTLRALHWFAIDDPSSDSVSRAWCEPTVTSDMLVLLMYTSGSTATPRGIALTHEHVLRRPDAIKDWRGQPLAGPSVSWSPLYHALGLVRTLNPFYINQPLVLMSPNSFLERPVRWLQAISRYQAVSAGGPNFAYQLCLERVTPAECAGLDLQSWGYAFCISEPIRASTMQGFAETYAPYGFRREALRASYGLSEAAATGTGTPPGREMMMRAFDRQALTRREVLPLPLENQNAQVMVGCGVPPQNTTIRIVNPETRNECAPNQVGEIWMGGFGISQGYWRNPQQTAEVFQAHLADTGAGPFLRTGDLGFSYEGELFIAGRLKEMLIFRGRNYYVQDIEQVAEGSHPALQVGGSAAFAVAKEEGDESALVLMHEVKSTSLAVSVNEVAKAVRRAMAAQLELPVDSVVLVKAGSLPRTPSGKIQRYRCRAQFLAQQEATPVSGMS